MKPKQNTTLLYLVKKHQNIIHKICLAQKKRGFGVNRFNGVGGKVQVHNNETIEAAAKREAQEEINVTINDMYKVAEHCFYFPANPEWDQFVHVYFSESWNGEPSESEEMSPQWFSIPELPYDMMWPDDIHWLPEVINARYVKGTFIFGLNDKLIEHHVQIVDEI